MRLTVYIGIRPPLITSIYCCITLYRSYEIWTFTPPLLLLFIPPMYLCRKRPNFVLRLGSVPDVPPPSTDDPTVENIESQPSPLLNRYQYMHPTFSRLGGFSSLSFTRLALSTRFAVATMATTTAGTDPISPQDSL